MAIIATFQNIDNANFNINGRNAPKIFNCIKLNNIRLSIVNVYDNSQVLFSNIAFDEIEVDGVVYGNLDDLVTAINPVIFSNSLVDNVSQAQLDAIQEIIDDLDNLYADINHLHEGVYLTEQEIINLIALNPQASDIASAEIVGVQLRFLDAQDNVLFSVNASPFFRQGNLLQYDNVTGKLSLRNQFFNLLSEVTIEPKSFDFDKAEFVTGIANDLSNLNLERDFYIVETLDESIYFVSALQELTFNNPWRFKVLKNEFEQDLQDADINNANLKAYELTGFDLTDIEDNEELKFDFWRITEPSGGGANQNLDEVLTEGNDTSLPIVFRNSEFRLNVDGVDLVSDSRILSVGFNNNAQILDLSSDLQQNREITFPNQDGVITLNPTGGLPYVRVNNEWRSQYVKNTTTLNFTGANTGSTHTVTEGNHTILFLEDSRGSIILPDESTNEGRELRIILHDACVVTPNKNILSVGGSTKYANDNPIDSQVNEGMSLTIQVVNSAWQIIHETEN